MSNIIASLRVALGLDSAQFSSGTKKVQRDINSIQKSVATLKAGMVGFASAFSVGFLARGIKAALDYAGSLGEISQQLGVTTRDLQVLRFAAGQVGVSQEQLETGLQKLTISMGKAEVGSKAQIKAFNALGITVDELRGKDGGQVFRMIADGLQNIPDRAQRAAVEVALFGKAGANLDNLLSGGSKALNELARAADELGIVLSDEQIQKADDTADKLEAVKTVLAAQIAGVVADNATSILSLASSLGKLTGEIVRFLNSNPQLALGIIGALLGGRVGGLPGAAIGAVGGAIAGSRMAQNMADSNPDLRFRMEQVRKAKANFEKAKGTPVGGAGFGGAGGIPISAGSGGNVKAAEAELRRQTALLVGATKQFNASQNRPAQTPTANVPQFLAGGGGGSKRKPKEDHSARDALTDAHRFDEDLRRADMDTLRAKMDLAHNSDERAALQLQMLQLDKENNDADLAYQVQLYKLTDGQQGLSEEQAKQLKAKQDQTNALEVQAVQEEIAAQKSRDAVELADQARDIAIEKLELESQLATTGRQKRDAELRILEAMKEQEKARLEAVLADKDSSKLAKAEAQQRLDNLDSIYAGRRAVTMQQNAGPMEQWKNQFSDISDELEDLKVRGIEGAVDALTELTNGWDSFKNAALSAIKQVIAELIRLQIMKMIANIASAAAGGMGGGFGPQGISAGLAGAGSAPMGLNLLPSLGVTGTVGFATGGSMMLGGRGGNDKNLLSLNGLPIARVSRGEMMHIVPDGKTIGGAGGNHFSVTVNGAQSDAQARRTGMQIALAANSEMSRARNKGLG